MQYYCLSKYFFSYLDENSGAYAPLFSISPCLIHYLATGYTKEKSGGRILFGDIQFHFDFSKYIAIDLRLEELHSGIIFPGCDRFDAVLPGYFDPLSGIENLFA
jgi:hypothetical protein